MKLPINRHEENLENWRLYLLRQKKELDIQTRSLYEREKKWQFYKTQIETAKKKKRNGFDSERYLVKVSK